MRMKLTVVALIPLLFGAATHAQTLPADADLDKILDALHDCRQGLKDFTADAKLSTFDNRTGDSTTQIGKVVYQDRPKEGSRLHVDFAKRKLGEVEQDYRQQYIFDPPWLIERDHTKKIEIKRQILRQGQKLDFFKLGDGPFPLPIGQSREEVRKQFDVTLAPKPAGAPDNTVHIKLAPREGTSFHKQFKRLTISVDRDSHWPVRINTLDRSGNSSRVAELSNLKINAGIKDEAFNLPDLAGQGWNRKEEPMRQE